MLNTEAEFVEALHELRDAVGTPPIQRIADLANVSRSHVSLMFRGHLGSWNATKAVLLALGVDHKELAPWSRDWRTAVKAPAGSNFRPRGRAVAGVFDDDPQESVLVQLAAIRVLLERVLEHLEEGGGRRELGA